MAHSLCMIFETIGPYNAIGKIAMAEVRAALDAGFQVSCVANLLDESLRNDVEWLKLYRPPRGFALQWLTARRFIRAALGDRRFDVVHAHQPQAASLADVFQCHFLTRVAYERKCLETRRSLRARAVRVQQQVVLYAEDRCYGRWNPSTRMLFCSDLIRNEFARLYRLPPREEVLSNPCLPRCAVSVDERAKARTRLIGRAAPPGPVVGYLGGVQERKGYRRLLQSLSADAGITLIFGGQYTLDLPAKELRPWIVPIGLVEDTESFYAACDIVVVPSFFDPCPLVVLEAVARSVPVIATDGVGNLSQLLDYGAGIQWDGEAPLADMVRSVIERRGDYQAGAVRMAAALSLPKYEERLIAIYRDVVERRNGTPERRRAHVLAAAGKR
jgi:glycosyltransferase involved in cell wall biosynthesis